MISPFFKITHSVLACVGYTEELVEDILHCHCSVFDYQYFSLSLFLVSFFSEITHLILHLTYLFHYRLLKNSVMVLFFQLQCTLSITLFHFQVCRAVVRWSYNLQSVPLGVSSICLVPHIGVKILLTMFPMPYFTSLWLFCNYQSVLLKLFIRIFNITILVIFKIPAWYSQYLHYFCLFWFLFLFWLCFYCLFLNLHSNLF